MTTSTSANEPVQPATVFIGLAPFLRASISGADLRQMSTQILDQVSHNADNPELLMNLSTAVQSFGQRDLGVQMQQLALRKQRVFRLAARQQPPKVRLLFLSVEGDIAANTPLDCLLEDSDVELIYYYVTPGFPFAVNVPEHDAVFVAISESDKNREVLAALQSLLANWPQPVINRPQYITRTGRAAAAEVLRDVPGLLIPATHQVPRALLQDIAAGNTTLAQHFPDCDFPIIVRPVGSHAGRNLEKLETSQALGPYLDKVADAELFVSRFIDYRGSDGLFRKARVALIDGKPYASHMGISSNWMIHYVNAGMYEDAGKRAQEAEFMDHFAEFAQRHEAALQGIYQRIPLDYVCLDCTEMPDGRLFLFEIDHTMVVHAMDPEEMFPFKQVHMLKVKNAFRDYLFRLTQK